MRTYGGHPDAAASVTPWPDTHEVCPARAGHTRERVRSAEALDDHGHALAAADAHRLETVGPARGLEAMDQRRHDAGTGHAEGVAQGDAAAMHVELVLDVDAEVLRRRQDLRRER